MCLNKAFSNFTGLKTYNSYFITLQLFVAFTTQTIYKLYKFTALWLKAFLLWIDNFELPSNEQLPQFGLTRFPLYLPFRTYVCVFGVPPEAESIKERADRVHQQHNNNNKKQQQQQIKQQQQQQQWQKQW